MATACPNCERALEPDHAFCPACGQAVIVKDTVGSFIAHFLGDYFAFDSKIVRSVRPLLLKPGFLTNEFAVGRRARYIPPLRMFIFLSVFFFLIIGLNSGTTVAADQEELLERVFWDRFFGSVLPKMIFLFMPCLAILMYLFHRGRPFLIAFVGSMHFHAFVFLAFGAYGAVSKVLSLSGAVAVNQWLFLLLSGYTLFYMWRMMRVIYPGPAVVGTLKFAGLITVYLTLLVAASVFAVWLLS